MAGDTTPIVNNWILDYYTYSAWREFKAENTISASTLDSIAGILGKTWQGDELRNDKKLFLTILSRLKDGSDINMRYYENCDDTPLEDLVPHFMNLVNLQIDQKLLEEGEQLYNVVRCEAVRACCRAGDFEKAKDVFERLKLKEIKDKPYVNMIKELQSLMKNKDTETSLSYDDFVSDMTDYLQLIADSFEEPTIIAAAKKLLIRKSCRHKDTNKNSESLSRIPAKEVLDEIGNKDKSNNNNNNERLSPKSDKQRLRKLWDQNVKEMFGDESPPHTEETEESSDVLFVNPKQSSSSKTPRKDRSASHSPLSKTSTPQKNGTSLFKVPARKPSTTDPSSSRTSTPKAGHSAAKSPFKRPTSTKESGRLTSPISTVSPVQRVSTSDRSGEESPDFQYRKNKGRADRHEPVISSSRKNVADDNRSVVSDLSSMYGGTKKRKWTDEEMYEFYDAVNTMGVGRWAQIKEYLNTTRTGVMLKDKWRNMIKSGDVERIQKKRQKKK
ncbi:telomeric repeat-binding factor 2-like [Ruditapes philippinarum]|uniref:telomeric repeat-binding factor 2-like n=1 Tax=Ruditapes philippinarum TaxID=129788 RepID=UPI00295A7888|nr:telomeric repeat-binding factor 2-like [Ruditapes philippinarum]